MICLYLLRIMSVQNAPQLPATRMGRQASVRMSSLGMFGCFHARRTWQGKGLL